MYRQHVNIFSVPIADLSRRQASLEKSADELKLAMLQAMLQTYERSGSSRAQSSARARVSSCSVHSSSRSCAAQRIEHSSGGEEQAPGTLQLLVRWELPREANRILAEQEYSAERTAPKLQQALQVVLERGNEKFLSALLSHADHRALTSSSYNPRELVATTNLVVLYNPDRVRRRDLVQKGDAFRLFRDLRSRVLRERCASEVQLSEAVRAPMRHAPVPTCHDAVALTAHRTPPSCLRSGGET